MNNMTTPKPMAKIFSALQYDNSGKRDLRVDFIRGFVMLILITVHIQMTSLYNYVAWERFGMVTGAEGFVLLSGLILGMLSRLRMEHDGFGITANKQFNRAFLLYRTSLFVIISVLLINFIPFIDAKEVMTFTTYGGKVYELYPVLSKFAEYHDIIIAKFFLLRYGPHQFQILGLYVVLLMISPFVLWLLSKKRYGVVLSLSWIIYFGNNGFHVRPIGAQFEYAFPLLTWQILFVHGLVIGYYRHEIWNFFHSKKGAVAFWTIFMFFLGFLFFTYNNPIPQLSDAMKLHFIEADVFKKIYKILFDKNTLGFGRLMNDFAVLVVSYGMLSYFWKPINKLFGWFFIPLGQASLYVFILHVYACIVIANIVWFGGDDIWVNTLGHTLVFVWMWLMVRYKVLFNIIPR
ncbi:MAG TPA: OpgC protein [Campylobacterales bacterium]|nr:OpgC protein [Sulfurimonas sp.]HIP51455.1 OpgC protein [Campylobacterales bacterium]